MSVQDWYVDLRMDKETGGVDWAIAGQRLIESQDPRMYFLQIVLLSTANLCSSGIFYA